jgi:hypothetical protein
MDPYLEGEWSTSFQPMFVSEIGRQLNERLRPSFVALPNRRTVRGVFEDSTRGTTIPSSIPHFWVDVVRPRERRPVTVIEFLTPTNKRGAGRAEYLSRRDGFLRKSIRLVEIDLDRLGERVLVARSSPRAPYFVFVSRGGERSITEVWPIALSQPLPIIPIPLLPGDADAILDLQLVMNAAYDDRAFRRVLDYRGSPEIPLTPEQSAWVDQHLRAAGLRP